MNAFANTLSIAHPSIEELLQDCMISSGLKDEEIRFLLDITEVKTFKKGSFLIQEGQRLTACFHNLRGCVRQFYLKDGEEKTTFFYTEENSIGANGQAGKPVKYYLECLENTSVAIVSHKNEEALFKRFPKFEAMSRMELEMRISAYQEMLANYIMTTPEERYLNLVKDQSDLLERVPLYQLASFIGVKPETLSRIRRRVMSRD